jgi:SAM-dependent methyltransferase
VRFGGGEKPAKGDGLETVACNLCGSQDYSAVYSMPDRLYFREEFFTVVECNRCGLGFLNPRPTMVEMQKYYPAEYFDNAPTKSNVRYMKRRFSKEASYLRSVEKRAGPKRLLDVGCADGAFPRFMASRGWDVEGVEISGVAQTIKDFQVHTEEFQNIPVSEPRYDAVTAWAVLEHVHDPMAYFRKASAVLKKDGLLVFLVPNFVSVASRRLFCEDVPRHIYFFTRETVRQYLEKNGLRLEAEDNGRSIYKLAPNNWLGYMVRTRLLGREYRYEDVPLTSKEFRRLRGLPSGLVTSLKYAGYSPVSVIDRMLWPVIEAAQMLVKRYGVSTYVARKV